jgi:hypothetical protein
VCAEQERQYELETIRRGLSQVLQGGVRPAWLVNCVALLNLPYVAEAAEPNGSSSYARALALEQLIHEAIKGFGDGPYARAAAELLGADSHSCGRLLKDRRRHAAYELDVLPSTFRKNYEKQLLCDVAIRVWSIVHGLIGCGNQ